MLIFVGYLNYLVDSYLMYAASAIAINTVCRSACGAAAPLFTNYMFEALGVGGGGSLIGGVATLLAVIPFAFYKYGERIRARSRFAPTGPKKPDDEEAQRIEGEKSVAPSTELSPHLLESSSTMTDEEVHETQVEKKESRDDVQNALGEPRDENKEFGRQ